MVAGVDTLTVALALASSSSPSHRYKDTGQAPDFGHGSIWEGEVRDTQCEPLALPPFQLTLTAGPSFAQDPGMWLDKNGHYHMISHNGDRGHDYQPSNSSGDCGRHYFSLTGEANTWEIAALHGPHIDLGGCAYPRVDVPFADGSKYSFYRRERPHVVLGADGVTPVALTTAVIDSPIGPGMDGYTGNQRDACYTLLQEVDLS